VFALSKQTISEILGDIVQRIAFRNLQKWAFKKSDILNQLTPIQRERVIDRMYIRVYKTGQIVLHKGALKKEKIVIIHEGVVQGKNSSTIYQKGTIFGDEYLLSENNEIYEDPYFMITNGIVSEINTSEIESLLGSNFKDIIQKNEKSNQV
jgi:signal-transduction protein with cAMP-binding, CBS, and nucleotidyltransferase domain